MKTIFKGQQVIGGHSIRNSVDRVEWYTKNANHNGAFEFYRSKFQDDALASAELSKSFSQYRQDWKYQPKKWSSNYSDTSSKYLPLCLDLELAAICDLACGYCYRQTFITPDKLMKFDLAKDLIDQAATLKIPSLKLNWRGEPLLHPRIDEVIRYAKSRGILEVIINTNAVNLTDEMSIKLIKSGLDYIIFSFDGGTKETYEMNRVGRFKENKFEDVYRNIIRFCELKEKLNSPFPWTRVQMVLTPQAINEQHQYFDLFDAHVDEVCVNNYDERGQGASMLSGADKEMYLKKIEKNDLHENSHYMKVHSGEILVSSGRVPCDQPSQRLLVTYDGRVSMCCFDWGSMYTVGYVSSQSFGDPNYDKYRIEELIDVEGKGFELMKSAKMPPQLNLPKAEVETLESIWFGKTLTHVREQHANGTCENINICESCTYRGAHQWV